MLGGGAERQLAYLTGGLTKIGWDVHVAIIQGGENLPRLVANGAQVHRLPCSGNYDPRLPGRLFNVIRQVRPVAVQTWLPQMDIIGGAVCLASGTPWIVSERGSGFAYGARLKQRVRRILGAHADCVVANSTAGLDYWQTYRPTQSLAQRIIANIVPLDEIDGMEPEVEQHGLVMDGPQWVVYVGRLEPVKNVRTLLRALELVVQNSKYKALICGEGSLQLELAEYVRQRGLEQSILVRGYLTRLWSVLKRCAVFVSLSNSEGSPNAVLEAMACRCPIVVSDIPGHREILDDACAEFVLGTSAEAAADAVLRVLKGAPEVFSRVSLARRRVVDCGAESIAAQYEAVYRLVAEHRSRLRVS